MAGRSWPGPRATWSSSARRRRTTRTIPRRGPPDQRTAATCCTPSPPTSLLQTINASSPAARISSADVVGMTAGLRPLYDRPGRAAGEVSRSYEIVWGPEGLLSVLGGKLTLHRLAAQEAVRFLEPRFGHAPMSPNGAAPLLPGGRWDQPAVRIGAQLRASGVTPETIEHLMITYGGRSAALPEMLRDHPEWGEPLVPGLPHSSAGIPFARGGGVGGRREGGL